MDLLFKAYSNTSDDEPEPEPDPEPKPVNHHHLPFRPSKRAKPEYLFPTLDLQTREEAPLPGRYISKRERALAGAVSQAHEPNPIHRDHHVINQSGSCYFYLFLLFPQFSRLFFFFLEGGV